MMEKHSNTKEDLYAILEVGKDASQEEIKAAYRKMVLRYHPDVNNEKGEAEERIKAINAAYEILSNPAKRQSYDESGIHDSLVELETEAYRHIAGMLTKAILQDCEHQEVRTVRGKDGMMVTIQDTISKQMSETASSIVKAEQMMEQLKKIRRNVRMKPAAKRGFNVFACVIDKLTADAESQKSSAENHLKMLILASEIVSEYEDIDDSQDDKSNNLIP